MSKLVTGHKADCISLNDGGIVTLEFETDNEERYRCPFTSIKKLRTCKFTLLILGAAVCM